MRESATSKAKRYLSEGRVTIVDVKPDRVSALIRGDGHIYASGYTNGRWTCDCMAVTDRCSHLYALRLVTAPDFNDPGAQDRRIRRPA